MTTQISNLPGVDPAAPAWRRSFRRLVRDADELIDLLALPDELREPARAAARRFGLAVPRELVALMAPGDPADPLLRQVLPLDAENAPQPPGYVADPVGDLPAMAAPGLIHKYAGRALLVAAGTCAINCRYCFRRAFPYGRMPRSFDAWRPALERIAGDASIGEVILSGGDPLVLGDRLLERLARAVAAIPHVRRLRVHSRLPVVIPSRVCDRLLAWLRGTRLAPVMVIHANHPRELSCECAASLARLVDAGVPVLNQAVLLRGVNDDAGTLTELCERLADLRVMPYYLHQLDPVAGAAHFAVPERRGLAIMAELRSRLPGYAVPRYVREVPGAACKVEITAPAPAV